jgi:hypothetical protein
MTRSARHSSQAHTINSTHVHSGSAANVSDVPHIRGAVEEDGILVRVRPVYAIKFKPLRAKLRSCGGK